MNVDDPVGDAFLLILFISLGNDGADSAGAFNNIATITKFLYVATNIKSPLIVFPTTMSGASTSLGYHHASEKLLRYSHCTR